MGTSSTNTVIKYWNPEYPNEIKSCTKAKFNDRIICTPDGTLSPGSIMSTEDTKPNHMKIISLNLSEHPILKSPIEIMQLEVPPKVQKVTY